MICAHADAVPVESTVTGEVLAALCPECGRQLPATFLDLSDSEWATYAGLCADLTPAQDTIRNLMGGLRAAGLLT